MPEQVSFSGGSTQLKVIIDAAIDGIIVINKKGIIEMVNPAVARLFQYASDEMKGKNVSLLMPSPHKSQHDQYISNYMESGNPKIIGIGREVFGRKKDGTTFPLRLSISEASLDNYHFFIGILHDLTKEKEQEYRIKKLNQELEKRVEERTSELDNVVNRLLSTNQKLQHEIQERKKIEKSLKEKEEKTRSALEKERELSLLKSRFVSMASHEFRTPLSSILSAAELIELYTTTEKQDKRVKNVNRIKSAVNHLNGVLNEFLSLSKLESGAMKPNLKPFVFDSLAEQLLDTVKGILKKGQTIDYQGLGKDVEVLTDQAFMKNILINLLSNAVKYSGENTTVWFSALKEKNRLTLVVKDEGIGIPEEEQVHLFSRFFRAHNVENIPGTGLGLNIVKKYLDLLDGNVQLDSQLGKGSTFTLQVPIGKIKKQVE